jgi:hypothetical protein
MAGESTNTHTLEKLFFLLEKLRRREFNFFIMPSGARANEQYQHKLSTSEQIEELRKKRELLGMFVG